MEWADTEFTSGTKIPNEFFIQEITPKIRCLLNQSEGRSDLLSPLTQYNRSFKEQLTATMNHDPESCLPLESPGMCLAGCSFYGIMKKEGSG